MAKPRKVNTEAPESTGADSASSTGETAEAPAKEAKTPQEIYYRPLRARTEEDKLPKQAAVLVDILNEIEGAGTNGVNRARFVEILEADERLQTRQPAERIVSYYQSKLQTMGLVEHGRRPAASVEAANNLKEQTS